SQPLPTQLLSTQRLPNQPYNHPLRNHPSHNHFPHNHPPYNHSLYNHFPHNYTPTNHSAPHHSLPNYSLQNYSILNHSICNYSQPNYSSANYTSANYSALNYSALTLNYSATNLSALILSFLLPLFPTSPSYFLLVDTTIIIFYQLYPILTLLMPVLPIPHITNPMISSTQAPGTRNLRTPVIGTQVPTSYHRTPYGRVTSVRQPLILSDSSHDFGQRSYSQEFPTTYASTSGSCSVPPVTTSGQEDIQTDIQTDIQQHYPSQLEKLEVTVQLIAHTLVPSIGTVSGQLAALFHTIQEVKSDVQTLNEQYKLKEQDLTKEEIVLLWEFVKSVFRKVDINDGTIYGKQKLYVFLQTHGAPGISKSSFLTNMATILSEEKSKLKSKLQNSTIRNLPVKELAHSLFLDKTFKTATPIQQSKLKTSAAHWRFITNNIVSPSFNAVKWWAGVNLSLIDLYENKTTETVDLYKTRMYKGLLEQDCIDFTAETDLEELDSNNFGPFGSDNGETNEDLDFNSYQNT
ncbi:hypothetical protein L873DRAFT_1803590, partial [Choiromyces venosus 120613-1]